MHVTVQRKLATHEACDFCGKPIDGFHRYGFKDGTGTSSICNHCVMFFHTKMIWIDTLRYMPMPEYAN